MAVSRPPHLHVTIQPLQLPRIASFSSCLRICSSPDALRPTGTMRQDIPCLGCSLVCAGLPPGHVNALPRLLSLRVVRGFVAAGRSGHYGAIAGLACFALLLLVYSRLSSFQRAGASPGCRAALTAKLATLLRLALETLTPSLVRSGPELGAPLTSDRLSACRDRRRTLTILTPTTTRMMILNRTTR